MKILPDTWFCDQPIDLEHKQYVLLDYIQHVREDFTFLKLYPTLSDIDRHIQNIESFRMQQKLVLDKLRKVIGFNWQNNEIIYEAAEPTPQLKEVNDIIEYALPNFGHWKSRGEAIFNLIESKLLWTTVGIVPTDYVDEGYLMVRMGRLTNTYRYRIVKVILANESCWGINIDLVDERKDRLATYESIKNEMIRKYPELPVPLTIAVETELYPLEETVLPIVKRLGLMRIRKGIYS